MSTIEWDIPTMPTDMSMDIMPHSFVGALSQSLAISGHPVDLAWLMGASSFGFRIWVNEQGCPSATSYFHWDILPVAVEQLGYHCHYHRRYWHEEALEEVRRQAAHEAIVTALNQGQVPIVWDVGIPEWGVFIGYDDEQQAYTGIDCRGQRVTMPYAQLGRNEIPILSVAIASGPNGRSREVVIRNSLRMAIDHAHQKEGLGDRPAYQDGLPAYELWASLLEPGPRHVDNWEFSWYYAGTYYTARWGAQLYLETIAQELDSEPLGRAAGCYRQVAEALREVWHTVRANPNPDTKTQMHLAGLVRQAGQAEAIGIAAIEEYYPQ